jgi:Rrf2 family protein
MVTLREAGLVVATRGKHGGYRLARDPRAITLEQVVGALQGFDGFHECLLGLYACGAGGSACALHSRMEPLRTALSATLRDTTLVDLAGTAAATATGAGPSPARSLPI